jgi:hypothetical protein
MPWGFLLLQRIGQVLVQSVEGLFPERAMLRDPVGGGGERFRIEATAVDASFASALQETGVFENSQVFRDGGQRHIEGLREVGDAGFSKREASEDGAPRRVGESRERSVE